MRARALLASAVAALAACASLPAAGAVALDSAPVSRPDVFIDSAHEESPLNVSIDNITPRVLTTESHVTLNLTLINSGSQPITDPLLTIRVQTQTPLSLQELSAYFAGERNEGALVLEMPIEHAISAHTMVPMTVTLPREDLPFHGDYAWGPRGITATLSDANFTGDDHSVLIWDSGQTLVPAHVNVIVPWTQKTALASHAASQILTQLAETPGVTLAYDPRLLTTTEPAPSQTDDEAMSAPTAHPQRTPLARLLASSSVERFPLRTFDTDPALISVIADQRLSDAAVDNPLPYSAQRSADLPDMIWAAPDTFSTDLLRAYPKATIIAPAGTGMPLDDLDFTPISLLAVDRNSGAVSTVGSTEDTSLVVTHSPILADLLAWEPLSKADRLDNEQLLTAAGALFTRERPEDQRSFITVLPRDTKLSATALKRLSTLTTQRWAQAETLANIVNGEPTDIPRAPVEGLTLLADNRLTVTRIRESLAALQPLERSLEDPTTLITETRDLALASLVATDDEATHLRGSSTVENYTRDMTTRIHAEPSVTVNLINKTANFPVRVTNELPWDVAVEVTLLPSDPRLRVTHPTQVVLPASSTTSVEVPVSAIGAGDINVTYLVRTVNGDTLDDNQTVEVRLRAGWEDALTFGFGIIVALAFGISLTRTILRRLKSHEVPGAGGQILDGMIPVSDHPVDEKDRN